MLICLKNWLLIGSIKQMCACTFFLGGFLWNLLEVVILKLWDCFSQNCITVWVLVNSFISSSVNIADLDWNRFANKSKSTPGLISINVVFFFFWGKTKISDIRSVKMEFRMKTDLSYLELRITNQISLHEYY